MATLRIRSGQIGWLPAAPPRQPADQHVAARPRHPGWVDQLAESTRRHQADTPQRCQPMTLRPAAVLVLLTEHPCGPRLLLTQRAPDLGDYPGQLVFPGGASDPQDDGPVATATRSPRRDRPEP